MIATRVTSQHLQHRNVQGMIERRSRMPMQQVITRPEAHIEFINDAVHSIKAMLEQGGNLSIACQIDIITQSQKPINIAIEDMPCWIGCDLFKQHPILTNLHAHASIANIILKGAHCPTRDVQKEIFPGKLISAYKDRDTIALR